MNRSMLIGCIAGAAAVMTTAAVAGYQWNQAKTAESSAAVAPQAQYAEVVNVVAVNEKISTPQRQCHQETVSHRAPVKDPYQLVGTGTGAVLGGVLGHQVGKGQGKDVATVVGVLAGGYTGNRIQHGMQERDVTYSTVNHCKTVYSHHEKLLGYDVTYRYNGLENTVRMDHRPGNRLLVSNAVVPQDVVPAINAADVVPARMASNHGQVIN